eukprot:gene1753-33163_t
MGERKVLNKYYPPDFDPAKMPKGKKAKHNEMKVRMMLPMTVRCSTCGTFMYKGTKFNTRKEDVEGETYLGLLIFRFYYRCTNCAAEFCMKTDPKTADYIMEAGATRNYEPWRDKEATAEETAALREEEERGNAMKALENRTLDSKREMDVMNALDEMRSLKARHNKVSTADALEALKAESERQLGEQETGARDEDADDLAEFYKLKREQMVQKINDSSSSGDDLQDKRKSRRGGGVDGLRAGDDSDVASGEEEGPLAAGRALAAAAKASKQKQSAAGSGQADDIGPSSRKADQSKSSAAQENPQAGTSKQAAEQAAPKPAAAAAALKPLIKIVAKPKAKPQPTPVEPEEVEDSGDGLAGLLGGYGSSDPSQ